MRSHREKAALAQLRSAAGGAKNGSSQQRHGHCRECSHQVGTKRKRHRMAVLFLVCSYNRKLSTGNNHNLALTRPSVDMNDLAKERTSACAIHGT